MTIFSQRLNRLCRQSGKIQKEMAEFWVSLYGDASAMNTARGTPALTDFFNVSTGHLAGRSDDPARH